MRNYVYITHVLSAIEFFPKKHRKKITVPKTIKPQLLNTKKMDR